MEDTNLTTKLKSYNARFRFKCIDCGGSLFYRRVNGRIIATHNIEAAGKAIPMGKLPHTTRTLDRARREARCGR